MQETINFYKIFQRIYQRLLKEENSEIIVRKYYLNKETKIISEYIKIISRILDDILPK
jgi:hypothetical protein